MSVKSYRPVILESPFKGDVKLNKRYLEACMRDCLLNHDDAPFASHKMYTEALDDGNAEEREIGINAGFTWHNWADACIVYLDLGCSDGMTRGIANADNHSLPVEYRRLPKEMLNKVLER